MGDVIGSNGTDYSALIADIPSRPFPTYDDLSYSAYLNDHVLPNTPFLLSSKATESWSAIRNFRLPPNSTGIDKDDTPEHCSSSNAADKKEAYVPNLIPLRKYCHHVVPVADTLSPQFSEFERSERPLGEVLDLWEQGDGAGEGLYVKDWHLMAEIEGEGRSVDEIYEVPECLRDDWLNPPFPPRTHTRMFSSSDASSSTSTSIPTSTSTSTSTSDFRFCYLGPRGTFTPLHRDVYASYSWSANIVGRKIWWLFPPDSATMERITRDGELVFDVRHLQGEGGGIKILQEEGEVIWVPSGWHHQVVNIDFCISFNHNFFASPTLVSIYAAMGAAQDRVEEAIYDVKEMIIERLGTSDDGGWEKEWVDEVQGLLERDSGWGWRGFWNTVKHNVSNPPAPELLSPPTEMRNSFVRQVMELYRTRREWVILDDVRSTVEEVEGIIGPP